MEGTADPFYRTLADTNEIRLLHLQPGATNEPLICQLVHSNLLDKPQYEALSYMWGRKESPLQIELDGGIIEVRNNLWQALNHLRHPQTARILWIDALCINQNDPNERNHQVSQMGRIYQNAYCVVAWLGIADESSRIAMKYFLDFQPRRRDALYLQDVLPRLPIVIDSYIIDAISSVCSREYWTRLWIVQELVLAERINILYGSWGCSWHQFAIFLDYARDNIILHSHIDQNSSLEMDPGFSTVVRSQAMSIVHRRSLRRRPRLLVDLCKEFGSSKCEGRWDKVFGLRAFALDCCRDAVPVDYAISLAEISWTLLFHNASKHMDGKWRVSLAQQVLQALGITKQDLEDPTPFPRYKNPTEEAGRVDSTPTQYTPLDLLDIIRWAEVNLGGLGESEIEVAV
jgi:hypothetical protein